MSAQTITGTTVWMRSKRRDSNCICCDGPHIFSRGVKLDVPEDDKVVVPGVEITPNGLIDWVFRAVFRMPEGARIKITVEEVSE